MKFTLLILMILFVVGSNGSSLLEHLKLDFQGKVMSNLSHSVNRLVRLYEKHVLDVDDEIWDIIENPASEYDFIVVGAGSAGSVVAARLSEVLNWTVCVLEAGQPETELIDIPLLANTFQGGTYDWAYKMEPQDNALWGLIDHQMPCPRGKALGGSSVLNYMIYTRGTRSDYDKWAEMGNTGWSYDDVLPYFLKSEGAKNIRKADWKYHNKNGPQSVEDTYQSAIVEAMIEGGRELGFDYVDYNSPETPFGVSPTQSTTKNGRRVSTGRAFLAPVSQRSNLDIVTNALVTKILIHENTKEAYGVEYEKDGEIYTVKARKEVIICAGSINSPQLLMLSGIGPEQHLSDLGIGLIKDLPVGKQLQDHICFYGALFPVYFDWDQTSLAYLTSIPQFVTEGKGPFTTLGGVEGLCFIRTNISSYSPESPDIEIIFIRGFIGTDSGSIFRPIFRLTDDVYYHTYEPLEDKPVWTLAPILLHPYSVGKLELRSKDPHDPPLIYGNYFSDPENLDIKRMIAGIRVIQKFQNTELFSRYGAKLSPFPVYGCDDNEFDSDEYWECALRTVSVTLYHQMKTCKMGPSNDSSSVVDLELNVHGITKLRVADASIIPFVSAHTNAPSIMIGERCADFIKKHYRVI